MKEEGYQSHQKILDLGGQFLNNSLQDLLRKMEPYNEHCSLLEFVNRHKSAVYLTCTFSP